MFHETIRFCTLSILKFRNFNVQYNDSANHLINGCRAKCVMTVFLPWRKIKLSELFKLAFEEKVPWALHMTSSTACTLRIRSNSLRVSFRRRLHLTKREGSQVEAWGKKHVVCFSQNNRETKMSKLMMSFKERLNCFLIYLFSENSHQFLRGRMTKAA